MENWRKKNLELDHFFPYLKKTKTINMYNLGLNLKDAMPCLYRACY
ncbi:unnamed protein product [Camellia sinensis]